MKLVKVSFWVKMLPTSNDGATKPDVIRKRNLIKTAKVIKTIGYFVHFNVCVQLDCRCDSTPGTSQCREDSGF